MRGTPWLLTDGYLSCVREGKHTMQMVGEGDPLGGQRGYSYLAAEKKVLAPVRCAVHVTMC